MEHESFTNKKIHQKTNVTQITDVSISCNETTPILQEDEPITFRNLSKTEIFLVLLVLLTTFGDGVENYIPEGIV